MVYFGNDQVDLIKQDAAFRSPARAYPAFHDSQEEDALFSSSHSILLSPSNTKPRVSFLAHTTPPSSWACSKKLDHCQHFYLLGKRREYQPGCHWSCDPIMPDMWGWRGQYKTVRRPPLYIWSPFTSQVQHAGLGRAVQYWCCQGTCDPGATPLGSWRTEFPHCVQFPKLWKSRGWLDLPHLEQYWHNQFWGSAFWLGEDIAEFQFLPLFTAKPAESIFDVPLRHETFLILVCLRKCVDDVSEGVVKLGSSPLRCCLYGGLVDRWLGGTLCQACAKEEVKDGTKNHNLCGAAVSGVTFSWTGMLCLMLFQVTTWHWPFASFLTISFANCSTANGSLTNYGFD